MKTLQRAMGLALVGILVGSSAVEAQFNDVIQDAEAVEPAPSESEPFDPVVPDAEGVDPAPAPDAFNPDKPADDNVDPAPPAPEPFDPAPPAPEANPFDPQAPGVPDSPEPAAPPYSPVPGVVPRAATPDAPLRVRNPIDPFLPPVGMTTCPPCLIGCMGFYGHSPFVYSAANCFDLASACYKYGRYDDAIALLSHAIEQEPMAHYYYLRGMSEMKAGRAYDAIESADGVWSALNAGNAGGFDRVRERFNGPLAWQFRQLLEMRQPVPGSQVPEDRVPAAPYDSLETY